MSYVKGESCLEHKKKHRFKPSKTGATLRCTVCGSVRAATKSARARKSGRAAKSVKVVKRPVKEESEEEEPEEEETVEEGEDE